MDDPRPGTKVVLTPKQVAEELQVVEMTVTRLLRSGELSGFKVGASWRILRDDLDAYIAEQRNVATV